MRRLFCILAIVATMISVSASDLGLFGLKGNVKTITEEGTVYNFDSDGNLVLPKTFKIERDDNGYIKQISFEYEDEEFGPSVSVYRIEVNPDGLMQKMWIYSLTEDQTEPDGDAYPTIYEYNSEGLMIKSYPADYPESCWNYTYPKFDAKGNWITKIGKCTFMDGSYPTTRVIEYYP